MGNDVTTPSTLGWAGCKTLNPEVFPKSGGGGVKRSLDLDLLEEEKGKEKNKMVDVSAAAVCVCVNKKLQNLAFA